MGVYDKLKNKQIPEDPALKNYVSEGFGGEVQNIKYNSEKANMNLLELKDGPFDGVHSVCTNGLSKYNLKDDAGKELPFGVELIMSYDYREGEDYKNMLLLAAEMMMNTEKVVFPGNAITEVGLKCGFFNPCMHLYANIPFGFKHNFKQIEYQGRPVNFLMLFPIGKSEVDYLLANGKSKFEAMLQESKVDIFNFERPPVKV